ncbi:M50 family metallopeptidase [Pontixanthobacter gangjinensis]|uniref:M50 family peptidase n=1 Tax=Pontixanthobacter gangjinensis TaxID=1028742 RepID=A0A6I4SJX4_9SPHN|nr:M50 family metallopeptidase [Pontixanthobacter gangjinensis]MXO55965.1 M50 family peptidase [Pontixanthobacter gangjinensis]
MAGWMDQLRGKPAEQSIQPARFDIGPSIGPNIGPSSKSAQDHPGWLMLAAAAVVLLPNIPFGNYLIYPFTILSTWFHEMGHGLTAMLLGLDFQKLVLLENGSGYAMVSSPVSTSALAHALVSAGGPLGPALVGSAFILASQNAKARRIALVSLAAILILSTLIWVRSALGWMILPPIATAALLIAWQANEGASRFAVQFLGVHAAISMFAQWGYLFSSGAVIGGSHQTSDTGAIADRLLLPHWFWAAAIILAGTGMIAASLIRVLRIGAPRQPSH